MVRQVKQFFSLPTAERRWFWLCWWRFAKWHLIIQFSPYKNWKHYIFESKKLESKHSLTISLYRAIQLSEMAARHHVFTINCLRRCLVQQQLLAQYGYSLDLHFGVAKEQGKLKAHCWLTYNNSLINDGEEVVSEYTELTLAENQTHQIIGALR